MGPAAEEDSPSPYSRKQSISGTPPSRATGLGVPTTFFLKSEEEMNKDCSKEENKPAVEASNQTIQDSSYGVQSLEDAITSSIFEKPEAEKDDGHHKTTVLGKRKSPKNPVHPKIIAAAQRIISPESSRAGSSSSPTSSPSEKNGSARRSSQQVSASQPPTPFHLSPSPTPGDSSVQPSTPKSGSLKSLRLSDEEEDAAGDEVESQAVESSTGGEEGEEDRVGDGDEGGEKGKVVGEKAPQLVMPSIRMPTRRPFTERGKQMGKLKILIAGAGGKYMLSQLLARRRHHL